MRHSADMLAGLAVFATLVAWVCWMFLVRGVPSV